MKSMLDRVFRQRRRIIFSVVCVMLATSMAIGAGPMSLAAGGIAAALCIHIILMFPNQRRLCETSALGLWFATLLPLPVESLPMSTAASAALFWNFLYGSWTNRAGWHLAQSSHSKLKIDLPAQAVWKCLIPGESHPDDYWSGKLVDFDHDSEEQDTVYLRFDNRGAMPEEMTMTFLERDPGRFCRYYLEREGSSGFEDMTVSVSLTEPIAGTCHIETTMEQHGISVGSALLRWFDDSYGDELGAFAETVGRRRKWAIDGKGQSDNSRAAA
jgi:hypothetical protein